MWQQQPIADQLLRIIREIQLGRQSGVLTAQRGEGATLEEGSITFIKGQVMQARVGRRTSADALNWLSTWRNCHYHFASTASSEANSPGEQGRPRGQETIPFSPVLPTLPPSPPIRAMNTGDVHGASSPLATPVHPPAAPYRTQQVDEALRIIDHRRLSRTHRHLFLLIDGYRSTTELIHLLRRSEQEVYNLLHDLEEAALIKIPQLPL